MFREVFVKFVQSLAVAVEIVTNLPCRADRIQSYKDPARKDIVSGLINCRDAADTRDVKSALRGGVVW